MSYKRNSPIPVVEGGTGDQTIANHGVVVGAGTSALNTITPSASSGIPLISQGAAADPIFSTAVVAGGGTGATTLTNHGVLIGQGTSAIAATAVGTTGQVLTGVTGSDPVWASPAPSSISITGDTGGALTGNAFTFTGGTTGLTFAGATSTETLGGTLVVSNGGTGNTTFTAYSVICAGTTATGTFQNVSGLGTAGQVLTSNGAGALPSWQAGGGGGGITRIDGDVDYVTGSTVTINTDQAASVLAGKSVKFQANTAGGTFLQLYVSDNVDNTFIGSGAGVDASIFITGGQNISVGNSTLASISTNSTAGNTAMGFQSLFALTGGNANTAIGQTAGSPLTTGSYNTLLGAITGGNYTTSESSNILIGYNTSGTASESNTLRIGSATGTGSGELSSAYIQGIASVAVSNKEYVTIDTTTGQLGSDAGPSGALAWSVITANQTAAVNNGYFCNKAGTLALALPATSAVGDIIEVTNENTATGVQFTQAAGQQILIGNTNTTSGATGTLTSSAVGDTLKIVCKTANTVWRVTSSMGNWTPA